MLVLRRKNVDVLGLYNPMVVVPFPSQSPTIGISPGAPNGMDKSGTPLVLMLRRKNVDVLGRYTPIVVSPSPSQSPTIGISPFGPSPNETMISGDPVALVFFKKNVDVLGRYNPIVVSPSPSQSPTIGRSPVVPNCAVMSGGPVVFVFLRKKKLPLGRNTPIVSEVLTPACNTVKVLPAMVIVPMRGGPGLASTVKFTKPLQQFELEGDMNPTVVADCRPWATVIGRHAHGTATARRWERLAC